MRTPDFLVIGAQKCGTSWLYQTLGQHPEVFTTTPKGLYFFNDPERYAKGWDWYVRHFEGAGEAKAAGEFTPNYFWTTPECGTIDGLTIPELTRRHLPEVKLIVALRDPVERAVSAYYHHIKAQRLRPDQRLAEVQGEHGILSMGFYDQHLGSWLEAYPRDSVLVLIYEEEIKTNRTETLQRIHRFLGVDEGFKTRFAGYHYNKRRSHLHMRLAMGTPRLANTLDRILPGAIKNHARFEIPVHDHERAALSEIYAPHNARLAEMLGQSLPW
jgi:hypothetical protein